MKRTTALLTCILVVVLSLGLSACIAEHTHKLVEHKANEATCYQNGNVAYWQCSGCHQCFADAHGKDPIKLSQTVIAAHHTASD